MITWTGKKHFELGDTSFRLVNFQESHVKAGDDAQIIFKERWMIERYTHLFTRIKPQNIVELGIHQGGSAVFFHKLAESPKLVAIELNENRIESLDSYIRDHGLETSLIPVHGVNQADNHRVSRILDEEFGDRMIDLVIDDASHFLDETRASFNTIFPRLRPGAAYIIEDWSWAHADAGAPDDSPGFYPEREPLTKLLFEIVLACGSTRNLINRVEIDNNSAIIWRGTASLAAGEFDIASSCLARGRNLVSIG
ncbi:hypothetical protein CWI75_14335 [Kineobactrum sediminis]|uniref:Class I SAM-dependent methyltransferase n=1 Tax=Kineobactrum sediminis TaxID=1905677 RepID=A0A2N5XZR9_9GAMM|nr:CmcI family methyltransferase [Kineobactrum sediminis]PLW81644.1 hypothetical protein CWI75_14335 [Kineobactrum sediminis]